MRYLEIGVAQGDNMERILEHYPTWNYVGVDRWECVPLENEVNKMENWNTQEIWDEVYKSVLKRIEPYKDRASIIKGNSVKVLPTLVGEFDIIFVDGDHSYKGAKKDLELSLPLLAENGKIIVDDLHYREVHQAFQEFINENDVVHWGNIIEKKRNK